MLLTPDSTGLAKSSLIVFSAVLLSSWVGTVGSTFVIFLGYSFNSFYMIGSPSSGSGLGRFSEPSSASMVY